MVNAELGFLLGLVALFAWGVEDFLGSIVSRKVGHFKALFYLYIASFTCFVLLSFFFPFPEISITIIILAAVGSALLVSADLAYYKGLRVGNVSIVAPVSSSWGVITFFLAVLFLSETVTITRIAIVLVLFFGVFLASMKKITKRKGLMKGAPYALYTLTVWGVALFLIDFVAVEIGPIHTLLLFEAFVLTWLLLSAFFTKQDLNVPDRKSLLTAFAAGVLLTTAFSFFAFAAVIGVATITTPIASAHAAVTVLLALFFFKEKLATHQKIGVAIVILSVVAFAL